MEVYHGGYCQIEKPEIIPSRYAKDFGPGFYCTELRKQFWVLAKFKHPTHQVCYCTPEALKCLVFIRSEEI